MSGGRLFDTGAALERTQMAWARTGLALLATSALAVRLLLDDATGLAGAVALLGGAGAVVLLVVGQRRYRAVHVGLWESTGTTPSAREATSGVRTATAAVLALSVLLAADVVLSLS